jgi:hypothetical protein
MHKKLAVLSVPCMPVKAILSQRMLSHCETQIDNFLNVPVLVLTIIKVKPNLHLHV